MDNDNDQCPLCGHMWHGLPLTRRSSLKRSNTLLPTDYDPDTSDLICPGQWRTPS